MDEDCRRAPQGVLRVNRGEVLFGEASLFTGGIVEMNRGSVSDTRHRAHFSAEAIPQKLVNISNPRAALAIFPFMLLISLKSLLLRSSFLSSQCCGGCPQMRNARDWTWAYFQRNAALHPTKSSD